MEVLDLNEVCKSLKITVQTARNRISLGLPMPPSFKIGRRLLFLAKEVDKWIGLQASLHAGNATLSKDILRCEERDSGAKERA